MATHKSAEKRVRANETRRVNNKAAISKSKTLVKKVLDSKEKVQAEKNLKEAVSFLDKTTAKGRIHKNNAARKKARLTKFVNKISS